MNEELAKSIYDSNGGNAMFGDYQAYLTALNSNPKYVNHIYNKYGSKQFGSQSEFESNLKKKEPTQPSSGNGSNQTQPSSGSQPSQGKSVLEQAAEIVSGPKMSGTPQTPEQVAQSVAYAKSQEKKEPVKLKPAGPLNAPKASEPGEKVFSSERQLLDYMEELKANPSTESQNELLKIANDYDGIVSDINTNGSWSYESKAAKPGVTPAGKVAQPIKPTFQTAKYQLDQINAGKLDPKTVDPNGRWEERNEYDAGSTYFDASKGGTVTTQPGMKTKKVWVPSGEFAKKVDAESKGYLENKAAEMKAQTNIVERASNQKNWDTYRAVSQVDVTTPERELMDLEEQKKNGQIDEQYYATKKQELENRKKYSYKNLEATYLSVLQKTDPDKHREYSERYSEVMNALNGKGFETWEDANNFLVSSGKQNVIFEGDENLEDLIGIDQADTEFLRKLRAEAVGSSYAPIDRTIENASDRQVRQYMTDIQPVINDVKQFSSDVDALRLAFNSGSITQEEYKSRAEQLKLKEQELTTRAQQVQKETGVTDFDLNRYSKESEVQQNLAINNSNFAPISAFEKEKEKNMQNRQRWVEENPVLGGLVYGTGDVWRTFTDMVILETAKTIKPVSEVLEVGDGYGWADRVYYGAETAQNNRDYLYGYSGTDIDGDGKADDLPEFAKLTQTLGQGIGSVGAFALPGAAAGKMFSGAGKLSTLGRFGVNTTGAFLMMEGQAYQEALRAGLSQDDAAESATLIASLQAVAEQIIPDIKYFDNVATRAGLIASYKAGIRGNALLRQGLGKIEELSKNIVKGGVPEYGEEYFGALSTDLGKDISNELYNRVTTFNMDGTRPATYKTNPYQDLYQAKNLTDNGVAGFITGGGMRFFGGLRPMSQTQMQNLSYMGKNANDILKIIEQTQSNGVNPGDATFKEIEKQLTGISETWNALQSMPGFTELTTANQDAVMALTYRKNQIQENARKVGVTTDAVKTALAQYDQDINDYLTGKKDYGATKPVMYNDDNLMAMGVRNVAVNPDGTYVIQPREDLDLDAAEVAKKADEYIKTSLKDNAFADSFYHPKTDRDAIQEKESLSLLEISENGKLQGNQNFVSKRSQVERGIENEKKTNYSDEETSRRMDTTSSWLQAIERNDREESKNKANEMLGEYLRIQEGGSNVSSNNDLRGKEVSAQGNNGTTSGQEVGKKGTRPSQEPQYNGQQNRESGAAVSVEPLDTSLQGKESGNENEIYRIEEVKREVVAKTREMFDMPFSEQASRSARDLQELLRKAESNKERNEIINEIKNQLYESLSQPSSAKILPRQQGETTETGGQPQGVGPSVKGEEVTQEGSKKEEVETPVAEVPTTEAKPAAGVRAVKPKVFDATRKNALLAKFKNDSGKRALVSSIDRAATAIRQAYGDVPIYVHETTADMEAATAITGGATMARTGAGTFQYDDKGNVIAVHVNMEKAGTDTAPHEFTHLILMDAFGDNPKLFKEFQDRILKALSASRVAELEAFVNQYTNKDVRPEEFLAQLAGLMTANREKLTPTTAQKIMNLINEFISRLTKGKLIPFKANAQTQDLMDFFNTVSSAMATGQGGEAIKAAAQKAGSKFETAKKPTEEAGARDRSRDQNKNDRIRDAWSYKKYYMPSDMGGVIEITPQNYLAALKELLSTGSIENLNKYNPKDLTEKQFPLNETNAQNPTFIKTNYDGWEKTVQFEIDGVEEKMNKSKEQNKKAASNLKGKKVIFNYYGKNIEINLDSIKVSERERRVLKSGNETIVYKIDHEDVDLGYIEVQEKNGNYKIALSGIYNPKAFSKPSSKSKKDGYKYDGPIKPIIDIILKALSKIFPKGFKGSVILDEKDDINKIDATNFGKGIGSKAYGLLAKKLQEEYGKTLISDTTRSDAAEALWRSFERKGLARVVGDRENSKERWSYYYEYIAPESGVKSKEQIVGEYGTAGDEIAMQDLNKAKDMAAANRAAQDIKSATGWEVGADGQWRYEYPDVELKEDIESDFDILHYLQENAKKEGVRVRPNENYPPAPITDILDLGKLEEAYPYLADVTFSVNPDLGNAAAVFRTNRNLIEFGPEAIENEGVDGFRRTLIHEIQHYVQDKEGFEYGGNVDDKADEFSKSKDVYKIPGFSLDGSKTVGAAVTKAVNEVLEMMTYGTSLEDIANSKYDKELYSVNPEAILKYIGSDNNMLESIDDLAKEDLDRAKLFVESVIAKNVIKQVAYDEYRRMAGEVEARNAEDRSRIPYAERLYGPTLESTEEIARRDQILSSAKKAVSAMDVIAKKRGVSKAAEIKMQREILGENYDKAKQISDNFEDIAEKLGITKICGL
jgi:predicted SprT family Zn-dependent metalloprotease